MNRITGTIRTIESIGNLAVVSISAPENELTAVILQNPDQDPFLKVGNAVVALFKETEVSIAKDLGDGQLSIRNRLEGKVVRIEKGKILSKIEVQIPQHIIQSVITTRSCDQMDIKINDQVTALIKSSEVMLLNPEYHE